MKRVTAIADRDNACRLRGVIQAACVTPLIAYLRHNAQRFESCRRIAVTSGDATNSSWIYSEIHNRM